MLATVFTAEAIWLGLGGTGAEDRDSTNGTISG
jgi:hypothetical protein